MFTDELVELIERDRTRGLEVLYHALGPLVRSRCGRFLREEDPRDILHEVFLQFEALARRGIRNPSALTMLAVQITERRVGECARRNSRSRFMHGDFIGDYRSGSPNPEQATLARERENLLEIAIRSMRQDYAAIMRRVLAGESDSEICAALNLTAGQLRNNKSLAKRELIQRFQRQCKPKP